MQTDLASSAAPDVALLAAKRLMLSLGQKTERHYEIVAEIENKIYKHIKK